MTDVEALCRYRLKEARETLVDALLWYTQALLLARYIRGDLDGYPPYVKK